MSLEMDALFICFELFFRVLVFEEDLWIRLETES